MEAMICVGAVDEVDLCNLDEVGSVVVLVGEVELCDGTECDRGMLLLVLLIMWW